MMTLQIYFEVSTRRVPEFKRMFRDEYLPALRKQTGYVSSRLLEIFPEAQAAEIDAKPTSLNLQVELTFETEEQRLRWVDSQEHQEVWPRAEEIAEAASWRAYSVVTADEQSRG